MSRKNDDETAPETPEQEGGPELTEVDVRAEARALATADAKVVAVLEAEEAAVQAASEPTPAICERCGSVVPDDGGCVCCNRH